MAQFAKYKFFLVATLGFAWPMAFASKKSPKPAPIQAQSPAVQPPMQIYDRSAESIIKNFMFIGDFSVKEEMRPLGEEVFWRYPTSFPEVGFDLEISTDLQSEAVLADFPATEGEGRPIEHLNRGRVYFLEGDFEEARKTWLSARSRFGRKYDYHRRADYFIAQAFLYRSFNRWQEAGRNYDTTEVKRDFVNTATFMAWAFDRKKEIYDPLLDRVAPRMYYNQAAIYYNYTRWAAVVGAATNGLDFLRRTGRTEYRRQLQRMLAEVYIRNRDYLQAVQTYDQTLRQDEQEPGAAGIFARIGDIYFDLNNFELAEEVYAAANAIDRELRQIKPAQYVLRGESLFWLGRFTEAQKTMQYALQAAGLPQAVGELDMNMQALASLRIADAYLALHQFDRAKLAYFQHAQEFRSHPTANFARIRSACLELPEYEGNNIQHARDLLAEIKENGEVLPAPAQEIAWSCEVGSYAQHERTPAMVERVRSFAENYPDSKFLKSLADPVREVQARNIDQYFEKKDWFGAVKFFEMTRKFLYPKVDDEMAKKLFVAYVDINRSDRAQEFIEPFQRSKLDGLGLTQLATVLVESASLAKGNDSKNLLKKNQVLAATMNKLDSIDLPLDDKSRLYVQRINEKPAGIEHLPWLLKLSKKWFESKPEIACEIVLPLLERVRTNLSVSSKINLRNETDYFIDRSLKDLLRVEKNCAYAFLEFELILHKSDIPLLADRYLKRDYIPIDEKTAGLYWTVAEAAHAKGEKKIAIELWKMLVSRGSVDLRETRYAQNRLKPGSTELENLWEN